MAWTARQPLNGSLWIARTAGVIASACRQGAYCGAFYGAPCRWHRTEKRECAKGQIALSSSHQAHQSPSGCSHQRRTLFTDGARFLADAVSQRAIPKQGNRVAGRMSTKQQPCFWKCTSTSSTSFRYPTHSDNALILICYTKCAPAYSVLPRSARKVVHCSQDCRKALPASQSDKST